ncbi:Urease accessory protein UreH [Streptosporangium subroseum]|uniref:Urease accessory protein UreD n=1 Tax=Streptosporangium subroseum TaxID=106412 RepID=A0A239JLW0_9ACTN|nr:urease accessory protein UreD [Streptosporangium subroseum]SNT06769.1 Urease accessory protein UreH [Streptosporangium subroseum]
MSPPDRLAMTSPAHGITAPPPDSGNAGPETTALIEITKNHPAPGGAAAIPPGLDEAIGISSGPDGTVMISPSPGDAATIPSGRHDIATVSPHPGDTIPYTTATPPRRSGPGAAPRRSMRARAAIVTERDADGRTLLATMRSDPPITLRRTGPGQVHLVSTAAGPLGGDDLALDIEVAPGTALDVRSVASTLVLPGAAGGGSLMTVTARVGAGASLRFTPEPTVLAVGCLHRMVVRLTLAEDARVFWREEIVFGRYGERPGSCHSRFDATFAGGPLLRQEFVVGEPAIDGSPAVYGDARCVGSTLMTGRAPEPVIGDGWAVLPLAGPGTLVSALGRDAVELRQRLLRGEAAAVKRQP